MKHPSQARLALHAGGDLGFFARWRTERHLASCDECRAELTSFESMREILPDLGEIPEIPWNRLAAEMKANIRLGLAAGECVRTDERPLRESRIFTGARAIVATASTAALMVTGLMLERPAPIVADDGMVVQTMAGGIQVSKGRQALRLMHAGASNVTYSVDAQGGMRARSVDPETGMVTINNAYAE
jgi:anti-sigma factor RsiW